MTGRVVMLRHGAARAEILPDEGGVAASLVVGGLSVLARTPWAGSVVSGGEPAADEADWVRRWRGGWQLCFPTAGAADPAARPAQGFHGVASQAGWALVDERTDAASLAWSDGSGLRAERRWTLRGADGRAADPRAVTLRAETTAHNAGEPRGLIVAEHLVLGSDLLAPVVAGADELRLEVPAGTRIAHLDYAGAPTGVVEQWPGSPAGAWETVDAATPARVAALVAPPHRAVELAGPSFSASVRWGGLPHLLLWEELARSSDDPWNGEVVALGLEPTSAPHGAGTAQRDGTIGLRPGEELTWWTELTVSIGREESS